MHEIVHIQVGQCGNQISDKFWEVISQEHKLTPTGLLDESTQESDIEVFFKEVSPQEQSSTKYVPRAVLVDLEPKVLDGIRNGIRSGLYNPENYAYLKYGAGNNWAKGHYTDGLAILDETLDSIRREAEGAENLQGFQLAHSLGGGTGSGLGTLLLLKIADEYPDVEIVTYSVLPSKYVSDTIVEPYNAILSLDQLADHGRCVVCLDNESLHMACCRTREQSLPLYAHGELNRLGAFTMSGVTTCLRFPGQLNADLRKFARNMVPCRGLHFLSPGIAPLYSVESEANTALTTSELTAAMFSNRNTMLANEQGENNRCLTAAAVFRGPISVTEGQTEVLDFLDKNPRTLSDVLPDNNPRVSVCAVSPPGLKMAATLIANSTAIVTPFRRLLGDFNQLWRRKAFVQWYVGEGMTDFDFHQAESNVLDVIMRYNESVEGAASISDLSTSYEEETPDNSP